MAINNQIAALPQMPGTPDRKTRPANPNYAPTTTSSYRSMTEAETEAHKAAEESARANLFS